MGIMLINRPILFRSTRSKAQSDLQAANAPRLESEWGLSDMVYDVYVLLMMHAYDACMQCVQRPHTDVMSMRCFDGYKVLQIST